MDNKISIELALHRIQQAKDDLKASETLYKEKLYKAANNRAYYSIFHSIRSVLSLEPKDFKRHKDVVAYFNQHYINTEIFPKSFGRRISKANQIREDSDYDDDFLINPEQTLQQIETAKELLIIVEEYVNNKFSDE